MIYFRFFMRGDIMKFKKLVSVLCSATCGIGGVGARQNGGMKEKFREILKARVVGNLIDEKVVNNVMQILESLDKDPEARKKVLELASSYKVKFWVRYLFSAFSVAGSRVAQVMSMTCFAAALGANVSEEKRGFFLAAVIFLVADLGFDFGASALDRSSTKYQGTKEALEELVKEAEGIRNQAGVSGNKLKKKKSGSSASNGGSQKSGKGSGKSKKRRRSKVKAEKAGNSAKNDNLVLN